jgi:hypothetical protein
MDAQHNDDYSLDASFTIKDWDGSTTASGNVKATTGVAIVGIVVVGTVSTALLTQDRWDPQRLRLAWDWLKGRGSASRPELPR